MNKVNKPMLRGKCVVCGNTKTSFLPTGGEAQRRRPTGAQRPNGGDLVTSLNSITSNIKLPWAKFPGEMHIPGMNFAGPGTNLDKRLTETGAYKDWSKPVDRVDNAAYHHDLAYAHFPDTATRNVADKMMLDQMNSIPTPTIRERIERAIIKPIISTKARFGLGVAQPSEAKPKPTVVDAGVKWSDELAEELHKPVVRRFRKRKVTVRGVDEIWAADLVDMQVFSKENDGVRYLLAVIDLLSKYGWLVPIKNKTGKSVAEAFKHIFTSSGRMPKKLWVDKGTEFYNKNVKTLGVELYSTENEEKSCVVERWNRTMKDKMYKYFTANSTNKYINVLDKMVDGYNNTRHSSIKMTPAQASENARLAFMNLNDSGAARPIKPKFSVGDRVRITRKKSTFEPGFTPRWTEEVFTISKVQYTDPPTYKITDYIGDAVQGSFYEQELQKTNQEIFRIEKVLERKGKKSLVKWIGYPESFNSWVNNEDLTTL